jgi:Fe-S-cluster containining protein
MRFIDPIRTPVSPPEGCANVPVTPQEEFVKRVYWSADEATAGKLAWLHEKEGIVSSCKIGCSHCCRFYILTNMAEIHALAQFVKRELSPEQITDLRRKTQRWHAWEHAIPGRMPSVTTPEAIDLTDYVHRCPLLVHGACIAYPVRPIVCRTHYVSTNPRFCTAVNDPDSTESSPVILDAVVQAGLSFAMAIRKSIEAAGLVFSRSQVLLPHGLAIEMGWDFAICLS